jgi:hypothetical protein
MQMHGEMMRIRGEEMSKMGDVLRRYGDAWKKRVASRVVNSLQLYQRGN